ncbi:hypothetical protein [Paenibacillus sp. JZ16]|uniref:hypothetical protein n=1 Tax=Paenibacillus sp. JZ16 TaxID=1906272 RepID=UPI00188D5FBD|nr:hypothetical protein [Paenibacillus sp. JZ16]
MNKINKVISTAALAAVIAGVGAVGAVQTAQAAKDVTVEQAGQTGQTDGLNHVDQKLIDAAQAKLKEFVKGPVTFTKAETTKLGDEEVVCFVISEIKMESEASVNENVTVKRDGSVVNLYLSTSYKELNETTKANLDSAWKQAFNTDSSDIERVNVHYTNSDYYYTGLNYSNITATNSKNESIDLMNGKLKK